MKVNKQENKKCSFVICIKVCISSPTFLSLHPHSNVSLVALHIKPGSAEATVEIRRSWPVFSRVT